MITVRRDAVRTQGRAPKGEGDQRDHEAVGPSSARSKVAERRPSEPTELLACECAPAGRRTVKTEPLPGSLATVTSPPIMRASLRAMARPSPVPPYCRTVEESTWVNS